ncbi:MAG TPA: hypothetical protein PKV67_18420 [Hyphomonas sp.]|nr:hypothetical protein [Hyphomonas sp.]
MTGTVTKLTELIIRGRGEPRGIQRADREMSLTQGEDLTPPESGRVIARDIESLAFDLYSIARDRRDDPRQLMRDALLSIEKCLEAIKTQH